VHRSRIARLDVPARAIFSSPAVFKREALNADAINMYNDLECNILRSKR